MFTRHRSHPPFPYVLAIDSGAHAVRLLLIRHSWNDLRVVQQETFNFQDEGLVEAEEFRAQLQSTLDQAGHPPLAIALPEHLAISQVLNLEPDATGKVESQIEKEALKLAGVSETSILYDFAPLRSSDSPGQDYWVTLCRTADVEDLISQLGVKADDIAEVSTSANALLTAYLAGHSEADRVVLVHLGATQTIVAGILDRQGMLAISFASGGDSFTRAVCEDTGTTAESAEKLKRSTDFLTGTTAGGTLTSKVDAWADELKHQLQDWLKERQLPTSDLDTFRFVFCGRAFEQPGLLAYLQRRHSLRFQPWAPEPSSDCPTVEPGFEIALGMALLALRRSPQPISVLPQDRRAAWKQRIRWQWLELATLTLLGVVLAVLVADVWHTAATVQHKKELLIETRQALAMTETNRVFSAKLLADYSEIRPLLARQQQTQDILEALALLETTQSNRGLWYVFVADIESYFDPASESSTTNATVGISPPLVAAWIPEVFGSYPFWSASRTNGLLNKEGLIAEFCLPGNADAVRSALSQVVGDLQSQPLFTRVDLLSDDLRRDLADPAVVVADRHYALSLEFKNTALDSAFPSQQAKPPAESKSSVRQRRPESVENSVKPLSNGR